MQTVVSAPKRFYAAVELDAIRLSRDASQVADEVVKHVLDVGMSLDSVRTGMSVWYRRVGQRNPPRALPSQRGR